MGEVCWKYVVELGMDYIISMMLFRTTLELQNHLNLLKERSCLKIKVIFDSYLLLDYVCSRSSMDVCHLNT